MFRKFHESELSQNNEFYAKSVCLGKVIIISRLKAEKDFKLLHFCTLGLEPRILRESSVLALEWGYM